MTLAELIKPLTVDNPITLYLYGSDHKTYGDDGDLLFRGFAMDIGEKPVMYFGVINPEEWEVKDFYSRLVPPYDVRYDNKCYTDELAIFIEKGKEPKKVEENLYLVAIAYSAYQDEETSFCTRYFIANDEEEAEELALGKMMSGLYHNGNYDAIRIEAVAVTKA